MNKLNLKGRWNKVTPETLESIANLFQGRLKWLNLSWCGIQSDGELWTQILHEFFKVINLLSFEF